MGRYVVIRSDRAWHVWDQVGRMRVLKDSYRACLTYAQRANRQLDLVPIHDGSLDAETEILHNPTAILSTA